MPVEVEEILEASPHAPARAREAVRSLSLGDQMLRNIELIVSELVTNSVVHAEREPTDSVALRLKCEKSGVSGEVCDLGEGFNWEPADPDLTEPGGLGLLLVDQLAADWGVRRNGQTCVWFECVEPGC